MICTPNKICIENPCQSCLPDDDCVNDICVPKPVPCSNCSSNEECVNDKCVEKPGDPPPPKCQCSSTQVCENDVCVSKPDPKPNTPIGAIIGGAVGGIVLIAICIDAFIFMQKKKKKNMTVEDGEPAFVQPTYYVE